jgi:anti-anti-sigma factor
MGSTLDINVTEERGVSILRLNGPVDANTQKDLENKAGEVINSGADRIIFDMTEVSFLGSAGLRALNVIAGKFAGDNQSEKFAHIKLLNPSDEVRRILKTLGFDDYIGAYDDLDQAINSF